MQRQIRNQIRSQIPIDKVVLFIDQILYSDFDNKEYYIKEVIQARHKACNANFSFWQTKTKISEVQAEILNHYAKCAIQNLENRSGLLLDKNDISIFNGRIADTLENDPTIKFLNKIFKNSTIMKGIKNNYRFESAEDVAERLKDFAQELEEYERERAAAAYGIYGAF